MRLFGAQSTVDPLRRVIVKRPEEAFRNQQMIQTQWQSLNYLEPPDINAATREHKQLVSLLGDVQVLYLPEDDRTTLDSLYPQDTALILDAGAIVFQTGKHSRRGEGPAIADALGKWNIPILGYIDGAATAEGGDLMFLDRHTLLAGHGFRTNIAGLDALELLLDSYNIRMISFDLPYSNGPDDVLHLMSLISLLDHDLAVIYSKIMPVALYQLLREREVQMIDVPDQEYPSQGCNVLAVAPRDVVMLAGNPVTRRKLETAGCRVREFEGKEISWKGSGGPTCLTKVLLREY